MAPPIRDVLRRHANVTVEMATVTELDLAARTVTAQAARRDRAHLRVRQPHRRGRRRAVVLRSRRVRPVRARHEDDRRRPRAAGPHLRRLRDGRERGRIPRRAGPGSPSSSSAAVRPGSRSPVRSPSCRASGLTGNFRRIDPAEARVVLVDGGKEILAAFGDRLSEKAAQAAAPARRDDPDGHRGHRGRRVRRRRADRGRLDASGSSPGRRSGPPACRPRRWPACSPRPAGRRATAPAGSPYSTTARCPAIPRCSRSAT